MKRERVYPSFVLDAAFAYPQNVRPRRPSTATAAVVVDAAAADNDDVIAFCTASSLAGDISHVSDAHACDPRLPSLTAFCYDAVP